MFRQLLVPLDFTDKNEAAVTIALETARRDGAEVTLLHVIETIEHVDFDEMSDFYRKLEARAAAKLQVLIDRFIAAGVRGEVLLDVGGLVLIGVAHRTADRRIARPVTRVRVLRCDGVRRYVDRELLDVGRSGLRPDERCLEQRRLRQ